MYCTCTYMYLQRMCACRYVTEFFCTLPRAGVPLSSFCYAHVPIRQRAKEGSRFGLMLLNWHWFAIQLRHCGYHQLWINGWRLM
ncbi:hypothetical protein I7I53_08923 [Histoplasma capsulatum var. duboisii H88]|uniref:Uncharacterized protein n=1 Tax=Ajellomyces capsulatus (strain H88) TaxID=544711 RepID=A0A8A1L5X2_AJEC8|nr:hypothetical protein I7I53_08923 [Histoplasma capsulatum var. duboisii H88]